jgi:bacterioferritin-associated ferredoxin
VVLIMYVCLCNAFTDRQVRALAVQVAGSAAAVYRCLGVQPKCGKCVPTVRRMVREIGSSSSAGGVDDNASVAPA